MACSSPKFAFTLKKQYKNGDRRPRFDLDTYPEIASAVYEYQNNNPDWRPLSSYAPDGVWLHRISCGQCLACRLARSREWADRACMEAIQYPSWSNWFLTLTFDNDHLVFNDQPVYSFDGRYITDIVDIEYLLDDPRLEVSFRPGEMATVNADDIAMFMKRLRDRYVHERGHTGIKFFACSEYGDKSFRPHYHILLFNAPLYKNQLKRSRFWKPGTPLLYEVDLFSECWHDGSLKGGRDGNPIGHVVVGEFNYNTAAYVARYITKKQLGKAASLVYDEHGIEPVSMRCSLRPGIGSKFMRDNWSELTEKGIYLSTNTVDKPLQVHMPHRMYETLCSPNFSCNFETGEVHYDHGDLERMYELMFIKCDQEEKRQLVRETQRQIVGCSEEHYLCKVLPTQLEERQKQSLNRERFRE